MSTTVTRPGITFGAPSSAATEAQVAGYISVDAAREATITVSNQVTTATIGFRARARRAIHHAFRAWLRPSG